MKRIVSQAVLFPILTALDFDVNAGLTYCGNDEEFYCDLIRELCEDVLAQRGDALEKPDPKRRREYAHLLKGTLQVLGETRASQRARELEQVLRNGEPDDDLSRKLLDDLDRIHGPLRDFFAQYAP